MQLPAQGHGANQSQSRTRALGLKQWFKRELTVLRFEPGRQLEHCQPARNGACHFANVAGLKTSGAKCMALYSAAAAFEDGVALNGRRAQSECGPTWPYNWPYNWLLLGGLTAPSCLSANTSPLEDSTFRLAVYPPQNIKRSRPAQQPKLKPVRLISTSRHTNSLSRGPRGGSSFWEISSWQLYYSRGSARFHTIIPQAWHNAKPSGEDGMGGYPLVTVNAMTNPKLSHAVRTSLPVR